MADPEPTESRLPGDAAPSVADAGGALTCASCGARLTDEQLSLMGSAGVCPVCGKSARGAVVIPPDPVPPREPIPAPRKAPPPRVVERPASRRRPLVKWCAIAVVSVAVGLVWLGILVDSIRFLRGGAMLPHPGIPVFEQDL